MLQFLHYRFSGSWFRLALKYYVAIHSILGDLCEPLLDNQITSSILF